MSVPYPELATIRRLERLTLKRITEIGSFGRLGQLQSAASEALAAINEFNGPVNVHLGFNLDVRLRGDRKGRPASRRIDLGALVEGGGGKKIRNASYSLVICRYADPAKSPVVRKLHFDYEPLAMRNAAEPKPSFHMQVCGKFSSHHKAVGYTDIKLRALYPSWEQPRVPVPPTSLALMLNWLLLEFQSDPASQGILNSPEWRNVVATAERTILVPYFRNAADFFDSTAMKSKRFLQTHVYEMTVD